MINLLCIFIFIQLYIKGYNATEDNSTKYINNHNDLSLYDMIDPRLFEAHNISIDDLDSLDSTSELFVYCQYARGNLNSKFIFYILYISYFYSILIFIFYSKL